MIFYFYVATYIHDDERRRLTSLYTKVKVKVKGKCQVLDIALLHDEHMLNSQK